jgi:hypothetical protein
MAGDERLDLCPAELLLTAVQSSLTDSDALDALAWESLHSLPSLAAASPR